LPVSGPTTTDRKARRLIERASSSFVEGVFEASVNLPQRWKCSGECGVVRVDTANHLLDEYWCFTSVGLANWGRCPRCKEDECPDMSGVARKWLDRRKTCLSSVP
jgi:hypothetical protein